MKSHRCCKWNALKCKVVKSYARANGKVTFPRHTQAALSPSLFLRKERDVLPHSLSVYIHVAFCSLILFLLRTLHFCSRFYTFWFNYCLPFEYKFSHFHNFRRTIYLCDLWKIIAVASNKFLNFNVEFFENYYVLCEL